LWKPVCESLVGIFKDLRFVEPEIDIYSCMTAGQMPPDSEQIRRLAAEQWANPVRFQETIETMYNDGFRIFLEVGPRANLTGFVMDILKGRTFLAMSSNVHHSSGITQLNHTLGLLAAHFVPIRLDALYAGRMPNKLHFSDTEKDTTEEREGKNDFQLKLALPLLNLQPEEIATFQGSEIRDSQKHPLSTQGRDAVSEQPCSGVAETVKVGRPGPSVPHLPNLEDSGSPDLKRFRPNDGAMQAYFQTMEDFLHTQQDIMRTYLEGDGISKKRRGPSK
jgi:acyl transferase domain-containing protein